MPIANLITTDKKESTSETIIESKKKILICEDDEDQAKYLGALLESAGFKNDIALNAKKAKNLLAKNDYHALLLDLILPDQDGIALIRELRSDKRTSNLPIIVISMIAKTGRAVLNGDAFSVEDWLEKPIDLNRLLSTIRHINKKSSKSLQHILHVEDDADTQHIIATLLSGKAKITATTSLSETRKKLSQENFDLVILDLILPDGNSVELLPLLSKRKIPVIVYSAIELDHEYSKYVNQALVKSSISNEKLLDTIKGILNIHS